MGSGEGVETLPQLMAILNVSLPEHWEANLPAMRPVFPQGDPYEEKYNELVKKIRAYLGMSDGNPFRSFKGRQMRVLQGDGVALDTVGDMLASLLANGFAANTVNFGSGGGLLQKLNRDSLAVAFKCCAMYVGEKNFMVGKDPIAGGKKSYGGNPPVLRDADGVLRNRGQYDAKTGEMIKGLPMSAKEFVDGVSGDQLVKVFENGKMLVETNFKDVQDRAKITKKALLPTMHEAVDTIASKMEFFQKMSANEAIACRLAEAACGSKWKHSHTSHLAEIKKTFPKYCAAFDKIGITDSMTSTEILNHIKSTHVCDKKAKSKIFRALADDEPAKAITAMDTKLVVTL